MEMKQPPAHTAGRLYKSQRVLDRLDRENLPTTVVAAGRAGGMPAHSASTLRTVLELAGVPAVRGLAGTQAHLRSLSLGNSHGR